MRCHRPRVRSLVGVVEGLRRVGAVALAVLALAALIAGCHGAPRSYLVELDEARHKTAEVRVRFTKANDLSNRAVMADTDASSSQLARDAEATLKLAENDVAALRAVLKSLGYPRELRALESFEQSFAEYRKVDRELLALAVENTNLKAQRLAFGASREAADGVRAALTTVVASAASKDRSNLEGLAGLVLLAVREIQVLQAPHVAEADDAAMTRLENEMKALKDKAHTTLDALRTQVDPGARSALAAAAAALERFDGINAKIVSLSRRNSDVRSLDLALRVKPPLAAACDESLRALQETLANEGDQRVRAP